MPFLVFLLLPLLQPLLDCTNIQPFIQRQTKSNE